MPANSACSSSRCRRGWDSSQGESARRRCFNPHASSTVTSVTLTNHSTKLTYAANLHNLTIHRRPGGKRRR